MYCSYVQMSFWMYIALRRAPSTVLFGRSGRRRNAASVSAAASCCTFRGQGRRRRRGRGRGGRRGVFSCAGRRRIGPWPLEMAWRSRIGAPRRWRETCRGPPRLRRRRSAAASRLRARPERAYCRPLRRRRPRILQEERGGGGPLRVTYAQRGPCGR